LGDKVHGAAEAGQQREKKRKIGGGFVKIEGGIKRKGKLGNASVWGLRCQGEKRGAKHRKSPISDYDGSGAD